MEGFSYDGTGEEARFYAGRAGEEGTLLSPSGEPAAVLEQLENRNLYLRYTLSAQSSCTIAGHRHRGRCRRHRRSGILYLVPVLEHSGIKLGPLIPVPDWIRHQHFCLFRYLSDWMPDSPKFRHLKKGNALHIHTAADGVILAL